MKKVSKVILLNPERKILLQLWDNKKDIPFPNQWSLFGGLVDEGESAEECVLREVYEELGIALEKVELVLVRIRDESGQSVEDNIFASKVTVDETKLELTEGADMKWFSVAELQEADIVPHFKNVIINYCNTL